jgi:hypothetical protein
MVTAWFVSNPLATSLALLALNGVVPIGWPETVEIVVWALVRINELQEYRTGSVFPQQKNKR